MDLVSFLIERVLKQQDASQSTIRQLRLASALSDVEGKGFPKELFQLSAPVVIRGLANFGILQMSRDWVYPYRIHQQLDPSVPPKEAASEHTCDPWHRRDSE
ncbi:MAG: hypothetical protein FJ217_12920 [Ignavibacteria bacterium]|nr:hypothetical protein [Ignavibacteria bacterium]